MCDCKDRIEELTRKVEKLGRVATDHLVGENTMERYDVIAERMNERCRNRSKLGQGFDKWRGMDVQGGRTWCYTWYKDYEMCSSCTEILRNIRGNHRDSI